MTSGFAAMLCQIGSFFGPVCDCAQVAEWLMAADCKSAAPWSYGGSNPPLCTMGWNAGVGHGNRAAVAGAYLDRVGVAGSPGRFGGKNNRPGQGTLGGITVAGFFRVTDRAHRLRFAIAWVKF
jgi:hypothetical protein